MARVEGVDPNRTGFMMRYVVKKVRKALGRDLTSQRRSSATRILGDGTYRVAVRREGESPAGGCGRWCCSGRRCGSSVRFESVPILPAAECSG